MQLLLDSGSALSELLYSTAPSQYCQFFFLASGLAILGLHLLPEVSQRLLMDYGPRARTTTTQAAQEADAVAKTGQGPKSQSKGNAATTAPREHKPNGFLDNVVGTLTSMGQTPHAWFNHFYVVCVVGSGFWAWQFWADGQVIRGLAQWQVEAQADVQAAENQSRATVSFGRQQQPAGMGLEQVVLTWALMALQGSRRLYECHFVMRPSKSTMWFPLWLLGLLFYLCVGVSVWVEGSGEPSRTLLGILHPLKHADDSSDAILHPPHALEVRRLFSPSRTFGMAVFAFGWAQQHRCHNHLASLKKYTLPSEGLFRHIVCAHYFCECLVYLGLATVAAPPGRWFNGTLWSALVFIVVNLGSTAGGTKQWYAEKFGADKVAAKWKMIPYVF